MLQTCKVGERKRAAAWWLWDPVIPVIPRAPRCSFVWSLLTNFFLIWFDQVCFSWKWGCSEIKCSPVRFTLWFWIHLFEQHKTNLMISFQTFQDQHCCFIQLPLLWVKYFSLQQHCLIICFLLNKVLNWAPYLRYILTSTKTRQAIASHASFLLVSLDYRGKKIKAFTLPVSPRYGKVGRTCRISLANVM